MFCGLQVTIERQEHHPKSFLSIAGSIRKYKKRSKIEPMQEKSAKLKKIRLI